MEKIEKLEKVVKKDYTKPVLTKNEPLTDITFASPPIGTTLPGTAGSPGSVVAT